MGGGLKITKGKDKGTTVRGEPPAGVVQLGGERQSFGGGEGVRRIMLNPRKRKTFERNGGKA